MGKYICEMNLVNEKSVNYVKNKMLSEDKLYSTAEYITIFNDLSRLKILHALSIRELCVCDIAYLLEISPSAISHQLRILRNAKIVRYRKEGKRVYYSLLDNHIKTLINSVIKHINH